MKAKNWTYMLRLVRKNPDQIPMDRLAVYLREFAALLGPENRPIFKGIKRASTGLKAAIPPDRSLSASRRLLEAKTSPESRPAQHLRSIERLMGEDSIKDAELLDASENVVYLFHGLLQQSDEAARVYQVGTVDGVVTGLIGADDTMHLHLRDHFDRDLRLIVRDELLARNLLVHFRAGQVRVSIHGHWLRTDNGWIPENNKCTVDGFELLAGDSLVNVFQRFAEAEGNEWRTIDNPELVWDGLRGLSA